MTFAAFIPSIILLAVLILVLKYERRGIMTGIIFVAFLAALFGALRNLSFRYSVTIDAMLPHAVTVRGIANIIMMIISMVPTIMIIITFWYGIKVIWREGLRSQNARTLGFGLILLTYTLVMPVVGRQFESNLYIVIIYALLSNATIYFILLKSMYTMTSIINLLHRKGGRNLDYLIYMGAGMKGDKAEELTKRRVQKMYEVWLDNPDAKVVVTGGWKEDEHIASAGEVVAMLEEKGIPSGAIMVDHDSMNTHQDIANAKVLIEDDLGARSVNEEEYEGLSKRKTKRKTRKDMRQGILNSKDGPKIALVSSNYHVLRSLITARQQKVKCIGYGAGVRTDYRMNAFVNEYFRYIKVTKKYHIIMMSVMLAFYLLVIILMWYYQHNIGPIKH